MLDQVISKGGTFGPARPPSRPCYKLNEKRENIFFFLETFIYFLFFTYHTKSQYAKVFDLNFINIICYITNFAVNDWNDNMSLYCNETNILVLFSYHINSLYDMTYTFSQNYKNSTLVYLLSVFWVGNILFSFVFSSQITTTCKRRYLNLWEKIISSW